MFKQFLVSLLCLFTLSDSLNAEKHEISGESSSALVVIDGNAAFGLGIGYEYLSSSKTQWGGVFRMLQQPSHDDFDYTMIFGPTFNLKSTAETAFVSARLGLEFIGDVASSNYFKYSLAGGYRFEIADNIFYKPYLELANYDDEIGLTFVFASLSFRF